MNDSHAYLDLHHEYFWKDGEQIYKKVGGYGRIKSYFDKVRKENPDSVIVLDNGDTIHGTYPVVKSKGEVMIPILNRLDFDAWTAHWDFAYGPKHLIDIADELNYPLLAINCYHEDTNELVFDPYKVMEKNGLKIGLIGIANTIVDKTMPDHFSEGIYLTLGDDELTTYIEELKDEKEVDMIVVFAHLGYPQEVKLATDIEGIDVLVSGHTHNRLFDPVKVNDTIIIQSGCHGSFIGRLDLKIEDKKVTDYRHELVEIDKNFEQDSEVERLVNEIKHPQKDILEEIVGETELGLARDKVMETTMDNLLLKSLIHASDAEMAFSNGWRYGSAVPPGKITMEDLWNIIPTNPPVSVCDITGQELWDMMEENLENTFAKDPYDQMGGYVKRCYGINMYFKIENVEGLRIQEFFVGNERLDRNKTYTAAFVTTQGIPAKYGSKKRDLDIDAITALKKYVKENSPVKPQIEGTIVAI
ncbi:MAG: 5'-nucleotidase C-terminal domain-containing protein [Candidatus Thermoplasmatota archaeon]|nr:5'-nucleotidase C-terminal domain-containing protein [Candidatus Thermoplasmatota archaeon]MBS3790865.1 5'-nucleotidase C-terminal domain-containing protein [Candidatus Thermoplasmatota archaeon]